MFMDYYTLLRELLVEKICILVCPSASRMNTIFNQIIWANKVEKSLNLIWFEAFQINAVTICKLY